MAGALRVERRDCASTWDASVRAHPLGSIFAASVRGRCKERRGFAVSRLAVRGLIARAVEEGCRIVDAGGIDPARDRGVYAFKRGLPRQVVTTGPLWLYGRNRPLATASAAAVSWR